MNVELLRLPPEVVLLILERLLRIDPITLLGAVPGVCTQLRALCPMVRGRFDLRSEWPRLDQRDKYRRGDCDGLKGALASAGRLFPRTTGLWTFSERPLLDACEKGLAVAVQKTAAATLAKPYCRELQKHTVESSH